MLTKTFHILPFALTTLALSLGLSTAQAAPAEIVLGTSVQLTGADANTGRYSRRL